VRYRRRRRAPTASAARNAALGLVADVLDEPIACSERPADDPVGRAQVTLAKTFGPEDDLTLDDVGAQDLRRRHAAWPDVPDQTLQIERSRIAEAVPLEMYPSALDEIESVLMTTAVTDQLISIEPDDDVSLSGARPILFQYCELVRADELDDLLRVRRYQRVGDRHATIYQAFLCCDLVPAQLVRTETDDGLGIGKDRTHEVLCRQRTSCRFRCIERQKVQLPDALEWCGLAARVFDCQSPHLAAELCSCVDQIVYDRLTKVAGYRDRRSFAAVTTQAAMYRGLW
jgi:hypothetical protein